MDDSSDFVIPDNPDSMQWEDDNNNEESFNPNQDLSTSNEFEKANSEEVNLSPNTKSDTVASSPMADTAVIVEAPSYINLAQHTETELKNIPASKLKLATFSSFTGLTENQVHSFTLQQLLVLDPGQMEELIYHHPLSDEQETGLAITQRRAELASFSYEAKQAQSQREQKVRQALALEDAPDQLPRLRLRKIAQNNSVALEDVLWIIQEYQRDPVAAQEERQKFRDEDNQRRKALEEGKQREAAEENVRQALSKAQGSLTFEKVKELVDTTQVEGEVIQKLIDQEVKRRASQSQEAPRQDGWIGNWAKSWFSFLDQFTEQKQESQSGGEPEDKQALTLEQRLEAWAPKWKAANQISMPSFDDDGIVELVEQEEQFDFTALSTEKDALDKELRNCDPPQTIDEWLQHWELLQLTPDDLKEEIENLVKSTQASTKGWRKNADALQLEMKTGVRDYRKEAAIEIEGLGNDHMSILENITRLSLTLRQYEKHVQELLSKNPQNDALPGLRNELQDFKRQHEDQMQQWKQDLKLLGLLRIQKAERKYKETPLSNDMIAESVLYKELHEIQTYIRKSANEFFKPMPPEWADALARVDTLVWKRMQDDAQRRAQQRLEPLLEELQRLEKRADELLLSSQDSKQISPPLWQEQVQLLKVELLQQRQEVNSIEYAPWESDAIEATDAVDLLRQRTHAHEKQWKEWEAKLENATNKLLALGRVYRTLENQHQQNPPSQKRLRDDETLYRELCEKNPQERRLEHAELKNRQINRAVLDKFDLKQQIVVLNAFLDARRPDFNSLSGNQFSIENPLEPAKTAIPAPGETLKEKKALGEGALGEVYIATRESEAPGSTNEYAVKKLRSENKAKLYKEAHTHQKIMEIPGYRAWFPDFLGVREVAAKSQREYTAIATELVSGVTLKDLRDFLITARKKNEITNEEFINVVQHLTLSLLPALRHLGKANIEHLDLHGNNIMVEALTGRPFVIDFGEARGRSSSPAKDWRLMNEPFDSNSPFINTYGRDALRLMGEMTAFFGVTHRAELRKIETNITRFVDRAQFDNATPEIVSGRLSAEFVRDMSLSREQAAGVIKDVCILNGLLDEKIEPKVVDEVKAKRRPAPFDAPPEPGVGVKALTKLAGMPAGAFPPQVAMDSKSLRGAAEMVSTLIRAPKIKAAVMGELMSRTPRAPANPNAGVSDIETLKVRFDRLLKNRGEWEKESRKALGEFNALAPRAHSGDARLKRGAMYLAQLDDLEKTSSLRSDLALLEKLQLADKPQLWEAAIKQDEADIKNEVKQLKNGLMESASIENQLDHIYFKAVNQFVTQPFDALTKAEKRRDDPLLLLQELGKHPATNEVMELAEMICKRFPYTIELLQVRQEWKQPPPRECLKPINFDEGTQKSIGDALKNEVVQSALNISKGMLEAGKGIPWEVELFNPADSNARKAPFNVVFTHEHEGKVYGALIGGRKDTVRLLQFDRSLLPAGALLQPGEVIEAKAQNKNQLGLVARSSETSQGAQNSSTRKPKIS